MEFYSNCFIEMVKAKLHNPSAKIMYLPAFLNEVPCPIGCGWTKKENTIFISKVIFRGISGFGTKARLGLCIEDATKAAWKQ